MEYDPEQGVKLIEPAKYVALTVIGKTNATRRSGDEQWFLVYKTLAVEEATDDAMAAAKKSVGLRVTDRLIDIPGFASKWQKFLPAMFPEVTQKVKLVAEQCVGRILVIDVRIKDGNPEYDEPDKINVIRNYFPFSGDTSIYEDEVAKVKARANKSEENSSGDSEEDDQNEPEEQPAEPESGPANDDMNGLF